MKSFHKRILAVAGLGLFAVCAGASQATAQNDAVGSFTLSHEIRWGRTNLPAGDYTFTFGSVSAMKLMTVKGPNGTVFEAAVAIDKAETSGPSVLILEPRGGTFFVREMDLAEIGLRLQYFVPAPSKNEKVLAQGPASTEQVLVAMAKK
jgi:hypothetical protein